MLSDFTGAEKVYICCGYTDLRQGIDGLSALVKLEFDLDHGYFPFPQISEFRFKGQPDFLHIQGFHPLSLSRPSDSRPHCRPSTSAPSRRNPPDLQTPPKKSPPDHKTTAKEVSPCTHPVHRLHGPELQTFALWFPSDYKTFAGKSTADFRDEP